MKHAIEQWLAARECFFRGDAHKGWRKLTPQELIALLKANNCMQPRRHAYVPLVFRQQTPPCFSRARRSNLRERNFPSPLPLSEW